MERISVRVESGLKHELEAEAREKGVSPSDVVREALEEHVRRRAPRRSCLDIARQIGVVGVFTDTPSDLSTNKDYFEGFGGG